MGKSQDTSWLWVLGGLGLLIGGIAWLRNREGTKAQADDIDHLIEDDPIIGPNRPPPEGDELTHRPDPDIYRPDPYRGPITTPIITPIISIEPPIKPPYDIILPPERPRPEEYETEEDYIRKLAEYDKLYEAWAIRQKEIEEYERAIRDYERQKELWEIEQKLKETRLMPTIVPAKRETGVLLEQPLLISEDISYF